MNRTKPEHQAEYSFKPSEYESPGMRRTQEELTRRAIELAGITGGRVLDIGCGTGFSTQVLADAGFEVAGIDPSKEMVAAAKARGLGCSEGSFEKIPFKDREFDAVVSVSALQWADYRKAAKEVSRVLKYSAKAAIQFYPEDDEDALRAAKAFAREGFRATLAVDNPKNSKKKKTFLVLER